MFRCCIVSVPVDTYATPGTNVYICLRPMTTMDMEYSLTDGYQYYGGSATGEFSKRAGRNLREEAQTGRAESSAPTSA